MTLRRGMTESFDLWDWCSAVKRDPAVRADARVVMLGDGGEPRAVFRLRGCLPARLRAPRLDAVDGIVAVEELQIACESLALEGAEPERPALRKAELRALDEQLRGEVDKERWVRVQLNPRDLRLSLAGAEAARLDLELWFESDDVRKLTERVAYFAPPGRRCGSCGERSASTGASRRSTRRSTSSRPTGGRCVPASPWRCAAL